MHALHRMLVTAALAATHPPPMERLERLMERLPLAWRVHERSLR